MEEILKYLRENFYEEREKYFFVAPFNIGAIVIESILQSGLNYNYVVKPRIEKFYNKYESFYSLSQLDFLLQYNSIEDIMGVNNGRKKKALTDLMKLLFKYEVEYIYQLQDVILSPLFVEEFLSIKGIGNKTLDYLMILLGLDSIAIDRHLFKFLKEFDIDLSYSDSKKLLVKVAEEMDIDLTELDSFIWNEMSSR